MKIRWNHITAFPLGRGWETVNGVVAGMLVIGALYLFALLLK